MFYMLHVSYVVYMLHMYTKLRTYITWCSLHTVEGFCLHTKSCFSSTTKSFIYKKKCFWVFVIIEGRDWTVRGYPPKFKAYKPMRAIKNTPIPSHYTSWLKTVSLLWATSIVIPNTWCSTIPHIYIIRIYIYINQSTRVFQIWLYMLRTTYLNF